jgi:hypothetical protein
VKEQMSEEKDSIKKALFIQSCKSEGLKDFTPRASLHSQAVLTTPASLPYMDYVY